MPRVKSPLDSFVRLQVFLWNFWLNKLCNFLCEKNPWNTLSTFKQIRANMPPHPLLAFFLIIQIALHNENNRVLRKTSKSAFLLHWYTSPFPFLAITYLFFGSYVIAGKTGFSQIWSERCLGWPLHKIYEMDFYSRLSRSMKKGITRSIRRLFFICSICIWSLTTCLGQRKILLKYFGKLKDFWKYQ